MTGKKRILFIFDRVLHYHQDLFRHLEKRLKAHDVELHLLAGTQVKNEKGRVAVAEKTIKYEHNYELRDVKFAGFTFRLPAPYLQKVADLKPDVVVCPAHPGDLGHWKLARGKKKYGYRLVAWQCGYEYNPGFLKKILVGRFVPQFDYQLAYHSNAKKYALRHGARADQIKVIHNTINSSKTELLGKKDARSKILEKHPEIGNRRILLYVGAILKEKKIEQIARALDLMKREDLILLVVGDGPYLSELKTNLGNRDDIIFTGQIVDVVGAYFDAAEVYILPGTGGLGINEAMAHGLPVVSGYADGSADDLVVDGETGLRLRTGENSELAEAIAKIIDDDYLSGKMRKTALQWSRGQFSFNSFIDRVEQSLLSLV